MKKTIFIIFTVTLICSCTKKETSSTITPVLVIKPEFEIGQKYEGGVIAYILQPKDPGYDANKMHGLIASPLSESFNDIPYFRWCNIINSQPNLIFNYATDTAIGKGFSNSNFIITYQGADLTNETYAASFARSYKGGGYTDWYLPSKAELNKLFLNKNAIGLFPGKIPSEVYWSSTESNNREAWAQEFITGVQGTYFKATSFYVRPIRSF